MDGARVRLNRSWVAGRTVDHPGIVCPLQRTDDRWLVLEGIDGRSPADVAAAPARPDIAVVTRMPWPDRAGRLPSMAAALADLRHVREG